MGNPIRLYKIQEIGILWTISTDNAFWEGKTNNICVLNRQTAMAAFQTIVSRVFLVFFFFLVSCFSVGHEILCCPGIFFLDVCTNPTARHSPSFSSRSSYSLQLSCPDNMPVGMLTFLRTICNYYLHCSFHIDCILKPIRQI